MKLRTVTLLAVAVASLGLSGCVIVPPRAYVAAPVVVQPAPVVVYPGWGYGYHRYRY